MREVTRRILTRNGYQVITAVNGLDAVQVAAGHPGDIDVLLTDVVMPQMLGKEAAERIRALYPAIKVLFMSGYTQGILDTQGVVETGVNLIEKPFTEASLLAKLSEIMGLSARDRQHLRDSGQQRGPGERLADDLRPRTGPACPGGTLFLVARHEQDRQVRVHGTGLVGKGRAGHARHDDIRQDQVGGHPLILQQAERLVSVRGRHDPVTCSGQDPVGDIPDRGLVVDHEHRSGVLRLVPGAAAKRIRPRPAAPP